MNTTLRKWALAGTLGLLGGWTFGARSADAQMNTYADVPFNQGSLFYRPSGARPPATTSAPPRAAQAPVYQYYTVPGGTTYYYPSTGTYSDPKYQYPAGTYYYPQYQYRPRRGLFGLFR